MCEAPFSLRYARVMNRFLFALSPAALCLALPLSAALVDVNSESKQIDALLAKDWQANKLQGNAPVDDATFVRRIYLDVVGRIPTYRETQTFVSDKEAGKRARLIDKLLASEGYAQHMFNFWADILRLISTSNSGAVYANFLKESLGAGKPYDQMVREMVSAQGTAWENGAIGYYMRDRDMPLDNMAATVRIFLGTRIECAQCHNHPFDKWTQMQFYEMAAFTYGVQTKENYNATLNRVLATVREEEDALRAQFKQPEMPKPKGAMTAEELAAYQEAGRKVEQQRREALLKRGEDNHYVYTALNIMATGFRQSAVRYDATRKVTLPHDYNYPDAKPNAPVAAATIMGQPVACPPDAAGPEAYAKWMTSPDNPRFTKVIANRLWKKVFGMGLIEPVDELTDSTEAMNPELMKHLEKLMVSAGYDMKAYLRVLYNTEAYQRSATKDEVAAGELYHFTGPLLRRMTAEQMWDSFVTLINPTPDMPNLPFREEGARRLATAHKLADALAALTPEEMRMGAEASAEKFRRHTEKVKELQPKITEARAKDDKQTEKSLIQVLNDYQQVANRSVSEYLFVPAVLKLASKMNGSANLPSRGSEATPVGAQNDPGTMMNGTPADGRGHEKIMVKGYDPEVKTAQETAAERAAQMKIFREEADFYGIPEKSQEAYIGYRQSVSRGWLRSAEMDSPAPRGHYLREFGQSDRETIENANPNASIPQVLVLMNSELLPKILDRFSPLILAVNKAPYPDDKVDAIYTTLLSRKPTSAEKEKWMKAQEQGLGDYEDLIYALINTQQFIFIQ